MNKKRDNILWNIKDFLSSTRVDMMTLEQEGAYRRALDKFYLNGYLPYDLSELAKVIGKGCSLETAKLVRSMFKVSNKFPAYLTHDYLEKLPDGEDQEIVYKHQSNIKQREAFAKYVNSFGEDDVMLQYAFDKFGLTKMQLMEVIKEFVSMKMATNEIGGYTSNNDIRRNFTYYIPYSKIVKNRKNGIEQGFSTNSKSITSKLQGW